MKSRLVFPQPLFQGLVQELLEAPQQVAYVAVGLHEAETGRRWLARQRTLAAPSDPLPGTAPLFRVSLTAAPPAAPAQHWPTGEPAGQVVGYLYLGQGSLRGSAWGFTNHRGEVEPLHSIQLAGPGMRCIPLLPGSCDEAPGGWTADPQPWALAAAALGLPAWRRLVSLQFAVVGAGRTGSLLAEALCTLGCGRLTLIDDARLQRWDLAEIGASSSASSGALKVETLAHSLRSRFPRAAALHVVPGSITAPAAARAAREADILCCCADYDAARLSCAVLAALYHRPLLDIGAGISLRQADAAGLAPREMGADVRLVTPGDGCLLCRGGLTNYAGALEELCRGQSLAGAEPYRAASLHSLNQVAVGLGLRMLEDFLSRRLLHSSWAHLEFDNLGRADISYPSPSSAPCALCSRAGLGDPALL